MSRFWSLVLNWKIALPTALVVVSTWYIVSQYRYLNPPPPPHAGDEVRLGGPPRPKDTKFAAIQPLLNRLHVTTEQRERIRTLSSETTNPNTFRRNAMLVLTESQRKKAKIIEKELAAERKAKREQEKAWEAKMFPGGDLEAAKAGETEIRRRQEQRRRAAGLPSGTPAEGRAK